MVHWSKSLVTIVLVVLTTFVGSNSAAVGSCRNPNGKIGKCYSIYECHSLLHLLEKRNNIQPTDKEFLKRSRCYNGIGRTPHVCCTLDTGFIRTPVITNDTKFITTPVVTDGKGLLLSSSPRTPVVTDGKGLLLPSSPLCGRDAMKNKILGGKDTELNEFPWTALIGYKTYTSRRIVFMCGGSLINEKYIITAAHCAKGKIIDEFGTLDQVRLGEYNTSTREDCDDDGDCVINQQVDISVEEVIPHKEYDPSSKNKHNDIALLRLARYVNYGDFIHPICMPWVVNRRLQRTLPTGTNMTVVGWGKTLQGIKSDTKQKLHVRIYDRQECVRKFGENNVEITNSHLCAGGVEDEDSCMGDSGGPLSRRVEGSWILEGIVSFGYKCGLKDWPGVYTHVLQYKSWIKHNLKA